MNRQYKILKAIIETYIKQGNPIGSKFLNEITDFDVSSATIRKEMNKLEQDEYVMQPHTSSGRVPTSKGYKEYLKNEICSVNKNERKKIKEEFETKCKAYFLSKARERVYDAMNITSSMAKNIAFATIPENEQTIYMWLSNILKQPEFSDNTTKASSVVEVFEDWLIAKLNDINITTTEVKVFVWEENLFEQFSSCSLLAIKYQAFNYTWVLWILWPMRMDYAYNMAILEEAKAMIEGEDYVKKLS